MASIEEQLSYSHYSTLVQFTIPGAGEITIKCRLDAETGGFAYDQIEDETGREYSYFRTKKWMIPMLRDAKRNSLYDQSLAAAVSSFSKKSINVIDVGTGTALLPMIVRDKARAAGVTCDIDTIEMSSEMASMASRIIKSFESSTTADGSITLFPNLHSTSYSPLPPTKAPYDICTSELLDHTLISEGVLPTMRDLFARDVIRSGHTVVVPAGGRVYGMLVGSGKGFDVEGLSGISKTTNYSGVVGSSSDATGGSTTNYVPLQPRELLRNGSLIQLSEPFHVFSFDWSCGENIPPADGRSVDVGAVELLAGTDTAAAAAGVLLFWELDISTKLVAFVASERSEWAYEEACRASEGARRSNTRRGNHTAYSITP